MKKIINVVLIFSIFCCTLSSLNAAHGKKKKKHKQSTEKLCSNTCKVLTTLIFTCYISMLQPTNGYYLLFSDTSCNPKDYESQINDSNQARINAIKKLQNDDLFSSFALCKYIGETCNSCPLTVCNYKTPAILTDNYACPENTAEALKLGRCFLGDTDTKSFPTEKKGISYLMLAKSKATQPTKTMKHKGH